MCFSKKGYHAQTGNRNGFLSTDFGLREFAVKGSKERLAHYWRFVYEKGGLLQEPADLNQGLELSNVDRFRYRTRYFTDSGIIGTKEFVSRVYQEFISKTTQNSPVLFTDWLCTGMLRNAFANMPGRNNPVYNISSNFALHDP